MAHLGPRMVHPPHNSGFAVRIVLQFYAMKGAKRDMVIILTFFPKKDHIQGSFVILA